MSKKLNRAEAQEWLESLQQVGEGWWRQVGLAVSVGAHTSLGLERREFAQAIGQRMVDSREAIIELHQSGQSQRAIADVLGISHHTVKNVLISEGLAEGEYNPTGAYAEIEAERPDPPQEIEAERPDSDDLQAEIDRLALEVQGERAKAKRDADAMREKLKDLRKALTDEKRKARDEAESELTESERERASKEADAWAEEQGRKILAGLSHLVVESVVGNLEEAASEMRLLIEQDAVTNEAIRRIESARAGFDEEFNVARLSVAAR